MASAAVAACVVQNKEQRAEGCVLVEAQPTSMEAHDNYKRYGCACRENKDVEQDQAAIQSPSTKRVT